MDRESINSFARTLLDDIDAWVCRTKSSRGELGTMVLNHPGFAPLLEKRGLLKAETDQRLRAFMTTFPDAEALPRDLVTRLMREAKAHVPWTPERHRSLMIRFGSPAHASLQAGAPDTPAPEAKPRISAAVIRAAKIDGRDLPTFVTALIDMGLECWRDDRIAHGEATA